MIIELNEAKFVRSKYGYEYGTSREVIKSPLYAHSGRDIWVSEWGTAVVVGRSRVPRRGICTKFDRGCMACSALLS